MTEEKKENNNNNKKQQKKKKKKEKKKKKLILPRGRNSPKMTNGRRGKKSRNDLKDRFSIELVVQLVS